MNASTIFGSVSVAATALLISSASFAMGPAPVPTKAQQKVLAAQIRHDARTQSFYKNAALPRHTEVTFSRATNPETGKRNGAPTASALVSAGRSFYNPRMSSPIETRSYTIKRDAWGKLVAKPNGQWSPVYTLFRASSNAK